MNLAHCWAQLKARKTVPLALGLLIASAVSWGFYLYKRMVIVHEMEQKLTGTVQERSEQIINYLRKQIVHASDLARQTEIYDGVMALGTLSNEELKGPHAQQTAQKLVLFLEEFSNQESFRNTILVSKDGHTFFSDYAPEYVGIQLTDPKNSSSALAESYLRAIMSLTPDVSTFSYDPILKQVALFITVPIFKENILAGFVIKKVSTDPIYSIIYNYIGLGVTGEVIIGKKVSEGVLYLSKTRDKLVKPFKFFLYFNRLYEVNVDVPLAQAATGHTGVGVYPDQQQKEKVSGWQYVPIADWGIVARISLHEIYHWLHYLYLLSLILTLLMIICTVIDGYRGKWVQTSAAWFMRWSKHAKHLFIIKLITALIAFGVCVVLLGFYTFASHEELEYEKQKSVQVIKDNVGSLHHMLVDYERLGKEISYDIFADRLNKQELIDRMKQDLNENPSLYGITIAYVPYGYSPTRRLYAPYVHRHGDSVQVEYLDDSFDYTKQKLAVKGKETQTWSWYAEVTKNKKLLWLDPYYDPLSGLTLFGYSLPFYAPSDKQQQEPLGVVNMIFDLSKIQNIVAQLDVETRGLVYLISQSGAFLYYPIRNYVTNEVTFYDLAREQSNPKLISIIERALKGKAGYDFYSDFATGDKTITYFEPIPITKWAIGIVLPEQDVRLPALRLRQYCMGLIFAGILLLFALLWLFGSMFLSHAWEYARVMTLIMCLGFIGIYYVIEQTPVFVEEDKLVVSDPIKLRHFEFKLDNFARQVNEEPAVRIPTGIYIYSAAFVNAGTLSVSGYIWQKFDKKLGKDWIIDPQLPEAVGDTRMRKIYEVEEDDYIIAGWFFDAHLAQNFDYSKYPLDLLTVRIDLEYADLSKNVSLIPALEDYTDIMPENLPGIGFAYGLVFNSFDRARSFFTLTNETADTDMGMKQAYGGITNHVYLSFNLSLMRRLLYDFIVLLLPLLIIFYSLYTIFMIGERDKTFTPLTALSAYTGLVFTAVILHGTFRARLEVNQLLYVEYLFFMFYVTFVLLVVNALTRVYKGELNRYVKMGYDIFRTFFWPIQMMTFFIITMIVFNSP